MKLLNKHFMKKICVFFGICLLVIGVLVLALWQWNIYSSAQKNQTYLQTLRTLIPEPQGAVLEEHVDNTMPTLTIDGIDFLGILEMPRYDFALPVCANWGSITKYPCRFDGSIYNGTMQIGTTSQKGQYEFYREISVGDTICFTDMQGNRYTYQITNLSYTSKADQTTLNRTPASLTIFIKNVYAFEYLIISCDISI